MYVSESWNAPPTLGTREGYTPALLSVDELGLFLCKGRRGRHELHDEQAVLDDEESMLITGEGTKARYVIPGRFVENPVIRTSLT